MSEVSCVSLTNIDWFSFLLTLAYIPFQIVYQVLYFLINLPVISYKLIRDLLVPVFVFCILSAQVLAFTPQSLEPLFLLVQVKRVNSCRWQQSMLNSSWGWTGRSLPPDGLSQCWKAPAQTLGETVTNSTAQLWTLSAHRWNSNTIVDCRGCNPLLSVWT